MLLKNGLMNTITIGKSCNKEDVNGDTGSTLVFFNPDSGIYIGVNVNNAFPLPDNPYFDESSSEEDVVRVLMSEEIPAGLAQYCKEQGKDKLPFFTKGKGALYLRYIDFLLRFWKGDNYHPRPQVTPTGVAGSDAPH